MKYQYLFTPIRIGPVTMKNRLGWGPNCPNIGQDVVSGLFDEDSVYYYAERAKGGVGLIIIGNTRVCKDAAFWPYRDPQLFDDRSISPLRQIASEVHKYGTKLFIQLFYGGAERNMEIQENNLYCDPDVETAISSPSQIPHVIFPGVVPKVLSIEEIDELVEHFGTAAARAAEAGLDGVELHSAAGYLHWQFMSPFFNKRQDQYGGSMANRARFTIETLQRIRKYVGERIAVGYKISTDSLWPGDLTVEDVQEMARYINSMVKVDFVDTSMGTFHRSFASTAPMGTVVPGYQMPYTAQIKAVVDVPVFGIGSINDPHLAEDILTKGQCDVVLMVRQLFADPEFVNKTLAGREDDIRPCVRTGYCLGRSFRSLRVECIQNPTSGRERFWGMGTMKPCQVKKRILIIGGGPAGLETARVARERGHDVVLYEKGDEVGGRVRLQSKLPGQSEIGNVTFWLETQVKKAGVRIVAGKEVTTESLETVLGAEKPDVVVIATGSQSARDGMNGLFAQEIPGWQQSNVYTYEDLLEAKLGKVGKVLLLDEVSNELAVGAALMLAAQADEVQLITRRPTVAQDPHVSLNARGYMEQIFRRKNIKLVPYTFITEISGNRVRLMLTPTMEERWEENVDAVVLMTMFKSENSLYPLVKSKVAESHLIGDAKSPRTIHEAILEGHALGRKL